MPAGPLYETCRAAKRRCMEILDVNDEPTKASCSICGTGVGLTTSRTMWPGKVDGLKYEFRLSVR